MSTVLPPLPLGEGWGEGGLRVAEPSAKYFVRVESALARRLEVLATALGGTAKLRGLVLSLAVRGQLTNSVETDGSASNLLAGINAERRHSAEKGSTKRDATVACLLGADAPFRVPQRWCWVHLGDVSTYGSCEKASLLSNDTWVLDLEDVEKDTGRILQWKTFAERRSQSDKNVFRSGDVLYGKLRPYLNKVVVADRDGVCTTEILPVRPLAGISSRYLKVALQSPYFLAYVNSKSYGMKMPRLGTEDGRSAAIPLPPLAEQHRIVARVEELMKLCDALEQSGRLADAQHARLTSTLFDALAASESAHALAENWQRIAEHFDLLLDRAEAIDVLEQTTLKLAVRGLLVLQFAGDESADALLQRFRSSGNDDRSSRRGRTTALPASIADEELPFDVPRSWDWARFASVARIASDLVSPLQFQSAPQVAPDCIEKATGRLLGSRSVRESGVISANHRFRAGQILYSKIRPSLSKVVVVDFDGLCSADMYPIETSMHTDYLHLFMLSDCFLDQVKVAENRVKMPKLNQEALNSFLVAVPPLPEQRRIVARVEELRRLCAQLRQRLTEARRKQSQLADALVAEVVA